MADPLTIVDTQRRELLRRLRDAQRAAMAEPDRSDAALLLEGIVLRLQAEIALALESALALAEFGPLLDEVRPLRALGHPHQAADWHAGLSVFLLCSFRYPKEL